MDILMFFFSELYIYIYGIWMAFGWHLDWKYDSMFPMDTQWIPNGSMAFPVPETPETPETPGVGFLMFPFFGATRSL